MAQGELSSPWFHLNFPMLETLCPVTAGTGGAYWCSAPRLRDAFSPSPARARTVRPLSWPSERDTLSRHRFLHLWSLYHLLKCLSSGDFAGHHSPFPQNISEKIP